MVTMSEYLVLAVGLFVISAFGGFFTLAFVSNNRAAGAHHEVIQALRGIRSNHICLAMQQSDTSQALLKMGTHFSNIDVKLRQNKKEGKPTPIRHISRKGSHQLRRSEGRCAQLFADRAIAIAEKTKAEQNLVASQDHIRQLLGKRKTNEDVARLSDIVAALGARIAQLEHQEQSQFTFPPTPASTTPILANTIATTPNVNGLSPTRYISIKPVESKSVSDVDSIAKIDRLETRLAEATKNKEELEDAAKASGAEVARLRDQLDVMEDLQYEQLALVNKDLELVKDDYRKLTVTLPTVRREAEQEREKLLRARFNDEKRQLEQNHRRDFELLQAELYAAQQKSTEVLSEQRKLETDHDGIARQLEREKSATEAKCKKALEEFQSKLDTSEKALAEVLSEQRKLETDLKTTKEALQACRDDPSSLLSDDQRQQLNYYPSLVLVLYGDGTPSNPGAQVQLHATTMELDNARVEEAALQEEISGLIDTNVALKLELEESKKSNAMTPVQVSQSSTPVCIARSSEPINKDVTQAAKPLDSDDTIIKCVGYVLNDRKKLINKTCRACEKLIALPHWQRGDLFWVPNWAIHMKTCSHKQESEKRSSAERFDKKTTSVARIDKDPKKDDLQEKTALPNATAPKPRQAWVHPPTYASYPTPESVQGLKRCNKCGLWLDFNTDFAKETFDLHIGICEDVVCEHEGCGDLMSMDHFLKEHQQVCRERTVSERKKLSFTEAAKLAPERQDTFDIFTADGTARKHAERAPVAPTGDGVLVKGEPQSEGGRKRGGLQGRSIWAAS